MAAPKKYPDEMRDRSVRLVEDLLADPEVEVSVTAACTRVGQQLRDQQGHVAGVGQATRGLRTSPRLDGSNTVGFDCSGLVLYAVHKATGTTLPRTAGPQGLDKCGTAVARDW